MGQPAADGEIVTSRVFAAPRERVFEAFRDPGQLAAWWGPAGFTSTFSRFDFRPGGAWRFVMHGPDGTDYPNANDFIDVVPPERVVFRHDDDLHGFVMTVVLAPEDGGTRLTWRMRFDSAAHADAIRDFVARANEQNFDRLAAHLAAAA